MIAYKLLRRRKDGTLGPLFINRRQHVPVGVWKPAEDHPTKGYAHRPGWHCTLRPHAPHLRMKEDRVWCEVELKDTEYHERPAAQGGTWVLGQHMRILKVLMGMGTHYKTANSIKLIHDTLELLKFILTEKQGYSQALARHDMDFMMDKMREIQSRNSS